MLKGLSIIPIAIIHLFSKTPYQPVAMKVLPLRGNPNI